MASTYLSRTPSSAGDRRTFTASFWVKRSAIGATQRLWNAGTSIGTNNDNVSSLLFESNDTLKFFGEISASVSFTIQTTQVFRDPSAWYHIVLEVDTTQATASDRVKIYINGEQITDFGTETYMAQNTDTFFNATNLHVISYVGGSYFDGSMAHFHFIDGTAYDADTFGQTDATTGIWSPKFAPSVTYGTNGFFLKFENSGAFGTDSSGNGNTFTVNGTMTQTIDTPTNVFATMNPLIKPSSITYSNGNNTLTGSNATNYSENTISTLGVSSGKYYWETKYKTAASNSNPTIGIATLENHIGNVNNTNESGYAIVRFDGEVYVDGTNTLSSYWSSNPTAGDIIMHALDMDNGKFYLGINGTWQNSADPVAGTGALTSNRSGTQASCVRYLDGVWEYNFGNGFFGTTAVSSAQNPDDGIGIFEYDVPTGFRALCTKSINAQEYD